MSARQTALRVVERTFMAVAVGLLGWTAAVTVEAAVLQWSGERQLDEMLARAIPVDSRATIEQGARRASTFETRPPARDELLGRVEIPRLGLRAVFHEGIDEATLLRAVGHIPGTAFPGLAGTVGLAAHRDSYFRPLKDVRVGDELFVTTPLGRIRYVVRETWIVEPDDTWVLDPTRHESVTLVTCYPFRYIGLAPQRFVVRAYRQDATEPEATDVVLIGTPPGDGSKRLAPASKAAKPAGRKSVKSTSRETSPAAESLKKPGQKRGFWKTLRSILS